MARKLVANQDNTSTSSQTEPLTREVARPIFGENVLAIDYNFAEKGILDSDIDFSRASGATQTNSEGKICYAPENGIKKSSQLDTWNKLGTDNTTITAATDITDPLGGNGAFRVTTNQANAGGIYLYGSDQVTKNNNTTVQSIYIRSVSGTKTTHVITHNSSSKGLVTITEEWQRIVIPYDSTLTAATNFYAVDFRDSDTDATDVYLFAPQVSSSLTGEAVEYVPTTTAFVYKERFDYSADGYGNSKGLLIEEARTNKITSAINLSSGISLGSPAITLASNIVDPSGGNEARKITQHASNVYQSKFAAENIPVVSPGVAWNRSIYCKAAEMTWVKIQHYDSANNAGVYFDLANGQIGTKESGTTATMEDVGNGWYRCSVTYTATNNAPYERLQVALARQDNDNVTYTGDGVSGIYIYGGQLEQGSFPTSLIPTYGATADRAADVASVSGTAFSRFFKDTEGTIVADVQLPRGWKDTDYNRLYSFNDGSHQNRITAWLDVGSGQEPRGQIVSGNTNQGSVVAKAIPLNTGEITRVGQTYATDRHYSTADSSAGNFDGTVTLPTGLNTLNIGSGYSGVAPFGGWIRRLRYFNKRKINAQVQKLTDTSFLLDKYKGAKAAHSLRSLRDGRDNSAVTRIRREYDSYEADYTAAQVSNGDLEKDFRSADQDTLPLDISVEAEEMIVGGDFTEKVTNGGFDSSTSWVATAPWSIANGVATWDDSAIGVLHTSTGSTVLKKGRTYTVSFDVVAGTSPQIWIGNSQGTYSYDGRSYAVRNIGHHTETFTMTSDQTTLGFYGNTNGTSFSIDNVSVVEGGWVPDAGGDWYIRNGVLNRSAANAQFCYVSAMTVEVGKTYDVSLDIVNHSTGTNYITFGGHYLTKTQSANGHYTYRLTATSTQKLGFYAGTNAVYSIDNVSVKEVNPIATGFSTRKINSSYTGKCFRLRNQGNVEVECGFDSNNEISLSSPVTNTSQNLLSASENFGEWTVVNSVALTANQTDPLGGQNAYLIQSSTTSATMYADRIELRNIALSAGKYYTASVFIKQGPLDGRFRLQLYDNEDSAQIGFVDVDFSASGVPSTVASVSATNINYEAVGSDGWYRLSFVAKNTTATPDAEFKLFPDRQSGNDDVYIFGAMLEETQYEDTPSGSELVTNGTFDDDISSWTQMAGATIAYSNEAINVQTTNYIGAQQFVDVAQNTAYRITFDVVSTTTSTGRIYIGTSSDKDAYGNHSGLAVGTHTFDVTTINNSSIQLRLSTTDASGNVNFDNVSVKELANLSPSTYAQTPVISNDGSNTTATTLGDFAGKENLLDYSEDFSNGAWSGSFGSTTTASNITDPLGGTSAYLVTENSANSQHAVIRNTRPNLLAGTHTHSCYVKSNGRNVVRIWNNGTSGSAGAAFNLTTGQFSIFSNATSASIETLSDGWYRISVTFTNVAGNTGPSIYGMPSIDGSSTYQGDGTSGFYLFGFQTNTNSLKTYQATTSTALTGDVNVVNWYDQAGGEDFVNSTAGEQPRIVMGSELVTDSGGKASLYFDGGDTLQNSTLAGQNRLDSYTILESSDNNYILLSDVTDNSRFGFSVFDGSSTANTSLNYGTPTFYANGALQSFSNRNESHDALTGSTKLLSQNNANTSAWASLTLGHYYNGTSSSDYNFTGKISEMVFFPNMDSSPKRFPIEQNMLRHFKPYVLNEPFDDNSNNWTLTTTSPSTNVLENGAVTATVVGTSNNYTKTSILTGTASDRLFDYDTNFTYRLTVVAQGTSGGQIRFRDDTSNNGGLTTSNGVVTFDGTLQTFVFEWQPNDNSDELVFERHTGDQTYTVYDLKLEQIGVDGFINTLYDQTGNNCHALQSTAANQCQIVSGGDLIKSGGHPAWEHLSLSNMELFGKLKVAHLDAWFVADTSDTHYLYPANFAANNDFGWVAQDGTTSNAGQVSDYGGGDSKLYANGTLVGAAGSITRDAVHTALNGRKLVHHQDADTADWDKVQMGFYYDASSDTEFIFQGKFSEWIWYDSDQSGNKTGIEENINSHYNIYS